MVYEVFYNEDKVGELMVSEFYSYTADKEKISEIEKKEKIKIIPDIAVSRQAKDIPFFRVRIENCEKKGTDKYLNSQYRITKRRELE